MSKGMSLSLSTKLVDTDSDSYHVMQGVMLHFDNRSW